MDRPRACPPRTSCVDGRGAGPRRIPSACSTCAETHGSVRAASAVSVRSGSSALTGRGLRRCQRATLAGATRIPYQSRRARWVPRVPLLDHPRASCAFALFRRGLMAGASLVMPSAASSARDLRGARRRSPRAGDASGASPATVRTAECRPRESPAERHPRCA